MIETERRPLVVFVVGPTATGKSEFAIEAALGVGGEILNTDSVQVYKGVDIGTAKPSPEQMRRVPHHLFSFVPEGQTCTAGEFRRRALDLIHDRFAGGVEVFFAVGGSGFYVQALEKGMVPVPEITSETRESVERDRVAGGLESLYRELRVRDPDFALSISPSDTYRIKRALEVVRQLQGPRLPTEPPPPELTWSGLRRAFEMESEASRPFDVLKIGITRPRPLIRRSVEERTMAMLERGLIEEVEDFRARGFGSWAPLLSVGYKETQAFLDGALSRAELAPAIVTSTMQLVKRQTTWFRRDEDIRWFDAGQGWDEALRFVGDAVKSRRARQS